MRLLMSIPTWLSLMSLNSLFCMVSSSTAKTRLVALPLLLLLRSPRYCAAMAPEKFLLWATKNAMPLALTSG
uniref:Secreted protein n=1 Tax=Arundo donax TaxID=35708 RepID=A0A0A9HE29_ARUDO